MKTTKFCLFVVSFFIILNCQLLEKIHGNIIINGDFNSGLSSWFQWTDVAKGANANYNVVDGKCTVTNLTLASQPYDWQIQLGQSFTADQINLLETNATYIIAFEASAESDNRPCRLYFGMNQAPWTPYVYENIVLNSQSKTFYFKFTVSTIYASIMFCFNIGQNTTPIKVDNIILMKDEMTFSKQTISYEGSLPVTSYFDWADFDNDNDLDLLLSSNELNLWGIDLIYESYPDKQGIFLNNGNGVLTRSSFYTHVVMGSSSTGDYDNDGDIDYIISGANNIYYRDGDETVHGEPYTKVFQNNTSSFDPVESNIMNLCRSAVKFNDLDNEGDLDVIICGDKTFTSFVFSPVTLIYRNNGSGNFENINVNLKNIANGRIACFDYDRNGFSDILICGLDQNNEVFSAIYKNNGNYNFEEVVINLDKIRTNYCDWFDMNGDGNYDIITGGSVYQNMGDDNFSLVSSFRNCSAFGDFNNDGLVDLINNKKIYINEQNQTFSLDNYIIQGVNLTCADINNDKNIDIISTIAIGHDVGFNQYINQYPVPNTAPSIPNGLHYYAYLGKTVLNWNPSLDDKTRQVDITYNVCIGVSANPNKDLSAESDLSSGYRRVIKSGNAGQNNSLSIDLEKGSMKSCQVQAIDNNNLASPFSQEISFSIIPLFSGAGHSTIDYWGHIWADYNRDSKIEYICWYNNSTLVFFNNMGDFNFEENTSISLSGNHYTHYTAADVDNDNDVDLIGVDYNIIGTNNSSDFTFTTNVFPVANWGKLLAIKDFDNDGDNDYIISSTTDTRIYFKDKNNKYSSLLLENTVCDKITCFDYDNDSDIDIFISDSQTKFKNTGYRKFVKEKIQVVPYGKTYDFDNDGDIDVLDNNILYLNDNDNFVVKETELRKLSGDYNSIAGDYDNDGDYDIITEGDFIDAPYRGLYINDGLGNFSEDTDFSGLQLYSYANTTLIDGFFDIDNDNDLDIAYEEQGLSSGLYVYRKMQNNFNKPDAAPGVPMNIRSSKHLNGIELTWEPPTDKESGTNLTYNLRIGTSPGGTDVMSPASDLNKGNMFIPGIGSIAQPMWKNDTMLLGTYYWSVQAVDHGYRAGRWAAEKSFSITRVNADFFADTVCLGLPTTFNDQSISRSDKISKWLWYFGDGTTSYIQDPTHVYQSAGIYDVTLNAYSQSGESDSRTQQITVKPAPDAYFSVEPVCLGQTSQFINHSDINSVSVSSCQWDFGNGKTSAKTGNETQIYAKTDTAYLTIEATNGCADADTEIVYIGNYPDATILLRTGDNTTFCKGDSAVLLINNYDPLFNYQWENNGVPVQNTHEDILVVKNSGSYSLSATNSIAGCADHSDSYAFTRQEKHPAVTIVNQSGSNTICSGDSIYLTASGNFTGVIFNWTNETGGSAGNTQSIWVKTSGTYKLNVRYVGSDCWSDASNAITLAVNPDIGQRDITMTGSTSNCIGDMVLLSINHPVNYSFQWKRDSVPITGATNNGFYATQTGTYTVVSTNTYGCSKESANSVTLNFYEKPAVPAIEITEGSNTICPGDKATISVSSFNPNYSYVWQRNGFDIAGETAGAITGSLDAGEYSVKVSLGTCQAVSERLLISHKTALAKPEIYTMGPVVWILACSNDTAAEYKWYYNGALLPEARKPLYVANKQTGYYYVRISDGGECYISSDTILIGDANKDAFNGSDETITLYPNPNDGTFHIYYQSNYLGEFHVSVYNILGMLVYSDRIIKTGYFISDKIELKVIKPGSYTIQLETGNNILTKQIIIK
jgi:hypothetical protein